MATICPQLNFGLDNEGLLDGSTEDCLYLNVYVPANTRNNSGPLPVAGRLILLQWSRIQHADKFTTFLTGM